MQLLALSPEALDAAIGRLASELGINSTRAIFMVSKDPQLLFIGSQQGGLAPDSLPSSCSSSSNRTSGNSPLNGLNSSNGSVGEASRRGNSRGKDGLADVERATNRQSSAKLLSPQPGACQSIPADPSSSSHKAGIRGGRRGRAKEDRRPSPTEGPVARATSLSHALGAKQEDVVRLASSAPSVLSRPPGPLAAKLKRLAEVLGGVPVERVLRMATEEPSYLTHRPPAVDRRIEVSLGKREGGVYGWMQGKS